MSARRIAYDALIDITERGAYANLSLKKALNGSRLEARDRAWVSAMVYTTLDHLLYLDFLITRYASGKPQPAIRTILRMGLCQALFMNVPLSAACNESVKLARMIGKAALSGYVNAVMREFGRNIDNLPKLPDKVNERLSIQYSYPLFLVDEYLGLYGDKFTEELLRAMLSSSYMTIRANPPFTVDELEDELKLRGVEYERGSIVPEAIKLRRGLNAAQDPLFVEGKATVQSESAMLVCKLLSLEPGMHVLDACAAPGGKTALISEMMGGEGRITAMDLHAHRLTLMAETFRRLRVNNIEMLNRDASVPVREWYGAYDRVLVDAPCSGFGVAGKPDARYTKTDDIIRNIVNAQWAILNACAHYVKEDGILLYATCTISKRENEDIARAFMEEHPEFAPECGGLIEERLKSRMKNGMLQLFPNLDNTDGFFIARMRRRKI